MRYRRDIGDISWWRLAIWAAVSCAAGLRLAHFSSSSGNPLLYAPTLDESYYINLGKTIAAGFLIGEDGVFFMDPLYGYILGAIFYLFGDNLTFVRIIQIVLDSLNVALIYAIGVKAQGRTAGLTGAFLYAIYGVAFFYTLLILKTTLTITFTLLFTLALIKAASSRFGSLAWFVLGILSGVGAYLRGNLLLLAPLAIVFYWFIKKPAVGKLATHTAVFTLGLALALIPGAVRNYYVSGEIVLLNSQMGRLLYASNNPENLTGRYNTPSFSRPNPEDSERDFHREAERRVSRKMTSSEVSKYWTKETLKVLWNNRDMIPLLLYNKFKGTIGWFEIPVNHSFQISAGFSKILSFPLMSFPFALALGVPGLIVGIAGNRKAAWLLIPVIMTLTTVLIFYTSSRFRLPMVPFLLLGVGMGFTAFGSWVMKKELHKAALFGLVVALLYGWSISIPAPPASGTGEFNLARAYWKTNDLEMSKKVASYGVKKFPGQVRFVNLLGMIALSEGLPEEAAKRFNQALKINPDNAKAYHNLGLATMGMGAPADAIRYFKESIRRNSIPESYYAMAQAYVLIGDKTNAVKYYMESIKLCRPTDPLRIKAAERLRKLRGG